jgi:hypothetical protein
MKPPICFMQNNASCNPAVPVHYSYEYFPRDLH